MARDVNPEEEYFHREDQERIRKLKEAAEKEKAAADAQALKDLHYLRCGKCGNQMATQTFRGVDIDLCGTCGAVLLDPGELEQLAGKDASQGASWVSDFFSFARKKG